MRALLNMIAAARKAQAAKRTREARKIVLTAWDDAHRAYRDRAARGDTRGQHDRWPALRDAMNARLRTGA